MVHIATFKSEIDMRPHLNGGSGDSGRGCGKTVPIDSKILADSRHIKQRFNLNYVFSAGSVCAIGMQSAYSLCRGE